MKNVIVCALLFNCYCANAQQTASEQKMKPLFNGKNLDGWYSYLNSKGKNNDVEKIFIVEDGLLHISGKEFGYIATNKEYTNFHLSVEFKWGIKKYPPRDADTAKRDNGICYYMPVNEKDTVWPKSIECQIQEGDVGDIWLIANTTVVVNGVQTVPKDYQRVTKRKDAEKPTGQWNLVEVIVNNGKITYLVNGVVVNNANLLV